MLVVLGIAGAVVEHVVAAAAGEAQTVAAQQHARAQLLPHTPTWVLFELARLTARPDRGAAACGLLFTERGASEYAAAHTAPNCPAARDVAHRQIIDPDRYDRFDPATITVRTENDRTIVDGCHMRWRPTLDVLLGNQAAPDAAPGPGVGMVSVAPAYGTAWQITGYRRS